ncbi:MAG: TetR/AcrR family transcriptional regulator [Planctomycetes bacterium]|nr:TetR/AcrR family transcriptional regulator [Planctomycetota bacterium]
MAQTRRQNAAARPRRRGAADSRRRLLDAAIDIFAARGPETATLEEICARAGLNKRLVYHYFGSKEALYAAALHVVYAQFFSLEVELGSMLLPVEQLLATLVRRYYQFLSDHPAFVRLICYENLQDGRTAATLSLGGQKAPVITALRLALEKGQADRRFRAGVDVTQLLISIFALCFFFFSNQYTLGLLLGPAATGRKVLADRTDHVVSLLLHGIAHEDTQPCRSPETAP